MAKHNFVNIMQKGVTPIFQEDEDYFPTVFFSADASITIYHIVATQQKEVAWMGLVEQISDSAYLITKIYIPKQKVTSASVDIEPNAIAELVNQLLDEGEDPAKLRYHGHSHVNMGITPSDTDQAHMADYLEHADWFIREIRNKKGDSKIDVFDKTRGLAFQCVDTNIWELSREKSFFEAIDSQLNSAIIKQTVPAPKSKFIPGKGVVKQRPNLIQEQMEIDELYDKTYLEDPFAVGYDYWMNWSRHDF